MLTKIWALLLLFIHLFAAGSAYAEPCGESALVRSGYRRLSPALLSPASLRAKPTIQAVIDTMNFVRIRGGRFTMGSPRSETLFEDQTRYINEDQVPAEVGDFEILSTHVTQEQYTAVMGLNPSNYVRKSDCPDSFLFLDKSKFITPGNRVCADLPVDSVSFLDARRFVAKLNQVDSRYFYRIPYEDEWEFAARAGSETKYFFGDDRSELEAYAWIYKNSELHNHSVATKRPNAWGLYDMLGNVWEWCADAYTVQRTSSRNELFYTPNFRARVLRGGSWEGNEWQAPRSALRTGWYEGDVSTIVGFRVVREAATPSDPRKRLELESINMSLGLGAR